MGSNFQTGHGVMIREHNRIGDDVNTGTHSIGEHHVRIGKLIRIHSAFHPGVFCLGGRQLNRAKPRLYEMHAILVLRV